MSILYFGNAGRFDVRAMLTFGVSAKESSDAIGYFGTGFKYAVAIILRLGGTISIKSGDEIYEFTKSREIIRGKEFEIVKCNCQDAGFTTRLGINWAPWQAFRELWCNCKDEGGECSTQRMQFDTVISVDCREIMEAYAARRLYFLESNPLSLTAQCEIHEGHAHFVFYRGIAVKALNSPSVFSYNIVTPTELTEDRTLKYDYYANHYISRAIQNCTSARMLKKILTAPDGTFESKLEFSGDCSGEFVSVVKNALRSGARISESARNCVSKMEEDAGVFPAAELTNVQKQMLDRAVDVLRKINIDVTDFEIKTVVSLGDGVMGRAIDGVIYLSQLPFHMGTKQVASTLLEEWVHCKHGCGDFDRAMQSWLFDKILSMAEEFIGEPI